MQVKLVQRNIGSKRRFLAVSVNGDVMRSMPTNGWLTEAAAKKWADKNGHSIVTVERMKDSVDSIREKYQADAPSKAEIAKYYRFIVVAEGMDGKMIRPSGGSYYRKYEDALRAAKALEKPTTHHLFIEGEYADAPSMNHKALYTWRNPKAK
ncbi:MAG: hypothetical protein MJY89_06275 [Bacteroidales bacterium]|nr:hypothetical protein [Bacteroidales bacterium]